MKRLYNKKIFPFTYNGISDINPNLGYDIEQFWLRRNVASKFSTHIINFKSTAKSDNTFNYKFQLQKVYLVNRSPIIFIPKKQKQGSNEWVVSLSRTRKTNVQVNLLQYSLTISWPEWVSLMSLLYINKFVSWLLILHNIADRTKVKLPYISWFFMP